MSGTLSGADWERSESSREVYSPREFFLSEDGTQYGVSLGDKRRRRWRLQGRKTDAEWATIESLYETNQSTSGSGNGSFTFEDRQDGGNNSPGGTYTCEFLSRPMRQWLANDLNIVTVEIIEVG